VLGYVVVTMADTAKSQRSADQLTGFAGAVFIVILGLVLWRVTGGHVLLTRPGDGVVLHIGGGAPLDAVLGR